MAQSMDTTPDAVTPTAVNGTAGAVAAAVARNGLFADEHGRLRGVVLWYNVTLKFGFIVPEDPNAPVFRVLKESITAESDADDVQALQTNEIVHFSPSPDGMSALSVTNTKEAGVNFSKKLDPATAELEARKLLMPHAQHHAIPHPQPYPQMYAGVPLYGPPHPAIDGGGANGGGPKSKKRKTRLPKLRVDEEKIVYGKVVSWHPRTQWGHIQPDDQPLSELDVPDADDIVKGEAGANGANADSPSSSSSSSSSSIKDESKVAGSDAKDVDGDATMNGEGEGEDAGKAKMAKVALIVAEIDQIETAIDRLPGLNREKRVQFRVTKGPYPNTVTAMKVRNEDASLIEYTTAFMERCTKKTPIDDTIYKGTVAIFFRSWKKPYGFIKPEGTTDKKEQVFCHIVETNFMPLKNGAEVEYKLAEPENEGKGKPACCVTGPGGAMLDFIRPKKRPRPANPPSVPSGAPGGPPHAAGGAPGWTFAPAPAGGPGYHAFPPPHGHGGVWGPPPAGAGDFYGNGVNAYGEYAWPPSNNYHIPWGQQHHPHHQQHQQGGGAAQRRRSANFNNKKRKKSSGTSHPVVAVEERTCTVCNKTMTGKAPYDTHMAGKAHARKVQQAQQQAAVQAATAGVVG